MYVYIFSYQAAHCGNIGCQEFMEGICTKCGVQCSGVDSGGAGGARTPPKFEGSEKGRSLISAYRS